MLDAVRALGQRRALAVRMIIAGSLDVATKVWLRAVAQAGEVVTFEASATDGAARYLSAFDASLAASGTATLESALAGAPPVIAYKLSAVTAHLAKRLVQTPHVGLPNILLGARHYPELLQGDAEPRQMADALARVLDERPSSRLWPKTCGASWRQLQGRKVFATAGPARSGWRTCSRPGSLPRSPPMTPFVAALLSHDPTGASWGPLGQCAPARGARLRRGRIGLRRLRGALRELRAVPATGVPRSPGAHRSLGAPHRRRGGSQPFRCACGDRAARHPGAVGRGAWPLEVRGPRGPAPGSLRSRSCWSPRSAWGFLASPPICP